MQTLLKHTVTLCLFIFLSSTIDAQDLTMLVKDINTPENIQHDRDARVFPIGNKIYQTDGLKGGTKIIYTGADGSTFITPKSSAIYYYHIVNYEVNADNYFFIETNANFSKLLRYNFSSLDVLKTGTGSSSFSMISENDFYSSNSDSSLILFVFNNTELWKAGSKGVYQVKSFPDSITNVSSLYNYQFYTSGTFIYTKHSVWSTNLKPEGTKLLKDGFKNIGESAGDFFSGDDGGYNGTELWTAKEPVYMDLDINPGPPSSNPRNFNGGYFTATVNGKSEIWQFGYPPRKIAGNFPDLGSGSETKLIEDFFGYMTDTTFYTITKTGNTNIVLSFIASKPDVKTELVRFTDGEVGNFTTQTSPNVIYFTYSKVGVAELWQITNSIATKLLTNTAAINLSRAQNGYYVTTNDGKIYRIDLSGYNPAPTLPVLIKDFGAGTTTAYNVPVNNTDPAGRSSPFYADILSATTNGNTAFYRSVIAPYNFQEVSTFSFQANQYSSIPNVFNEINGNVLFFADNGIIGRELWKTDGTTAGTQLFKDLIPGAIGSSAYSVVQEGSFLYYFDGTQTIPKIWKTDGNSIDSIPIGGQEYIRVKQLFFTYPLPTITLKGQQYQSYYKSYSFPCSRGACPYYSLGNIRRLSDSTDILGFSYTDGSHVPITSLPILGDKFYFAFNRNLLGTGEVLGALWSSDGTPNGTTIVYNFAQTPTSLVLANGKLYFFANDGVSGNQLWQSDGTTLGTKKISNFPNTSGNKLIKVINDNLYLLIDGNEIWGFKTNGGISPVKISTVVLDDSNYIFAGTNFIFAKTDSVVGRELFKIPLPIPDIGTAIINQSDLAITQTVSKTIRSDSTIYDVDITVKNNGPQVATNVTISFTLLGDNSFFGGYSNYTLYDTIYPAGISNGSNYAGSNLNNNTIPYTRTLPSIGVNETKTLHYKTRETSDLSRPNRHLFQATVTATQTDVNTTNNIAETQTESSSRACNGSIFGRLFTDYYNNLIVTDQSPIVLPTGSPTGTYLDYTSSSTNLGDNYIRRMRGYLLPTTTGNYKFSIAGDDNVDVYLSTDANPNNKRRICYIQGYTAEKEFNKFPSQISQSITLNGSGRYYLEIVNAQKHGAFFYDLEWQSPTDTGRVQIPYVNYESFCEGSTASCSTDTIPPVYKNCPQNIQATVNNQFGPCSTVQWVEPTATDNCIVASTSYSNSLGNYITSGSCYPIGTTTVTYTATDFKGNKGICTFTISVIKNPACDNDITPPVFINCPKDTILYTFGNDTTAYLPYSQPLATDNCGVKSISSFTDPNYIYYYPIGSITRKTYNAIDFSNNQSFCTYTITVDGPVDKCANDSIPPVFTYCPKDTTVSIIGNNTTALVNFKTPTATDNCGPANINLYFESIPQYTIPYFPIGTSTLTYIAFDAKNNRSQCVFKVIVKPTTVNNCNHVIVGGSTIGISLAGLNNQTTVQIFNNDYSNNLVTQTTKESTLMIPINLTAGQTYHVKFTEYDVSNGPWNFLCEKTLDVTLPQNLAGCDAVTATTTSNSITLSGLNNTNVIQVFNNAYSANVFTQTTKDTTIKIPNLTSGQTYHVKFTQYDVTNGPWKFICEKTIDVNVGNVVQPVIDSLSLSITPETNTYKQFTNQSFHITATNGTNAPVHNAKIVVTMPDKIVGGNMAVLSVGTWQPYCAGGVRCNIWTIPILPANTIATMDITYFVNDATGVLTAMVRTGNTWTSILLNPASNGTPKLSEPIATQHIPIIIQKISPNPTDGDINLTLSYQLSATGYQQKIQNNFVEFHFYNTLGMLMRSEKRNLESGINTISFDVSGFASGLYFVVPQTNIGRGVPTKFVKQ